MKTHHINNNFFGRLRMAWIALFAKNAVVFTISDKSSGGVCFGTDGLREMVACKMDADPFEKGIAFEQERIAAKAERFLAFCEDRGLADNGILVVREVLGAVLPQPEKEGEVA